MDSKLLYVLSKSLYFHLCHIWGSYRELNLQNDTIETGEREEELGEWWTKLSAGPGLRGSAASSLMEADWRSWVTHNAEGFGSQTGAVGEETHQRWRVLQLCTTEAAGQVAPHLIHYIYKLKKCH